MGLHMSEWPARRCSGESCKQGRAPCQTPQACQLPEPTEKLFQRYYDGLLSIFLVLFCAWLAAALWPYVERLL